MNYVNHLPVLENDGLTRLSMPAEVFFLRLTNAVDRYGCFDARPGMLRGRLYALQLDAVTNDNMAAWLTECVNAGLVTLYQVNGLPYLQIAGYKRRVGSHKSPYPEPPLPQVATDVRESNEDVANEEDRQQNAYGGLATTILKPEPGLEHEFFVRELFKNENATHLHRLAEGCRQLAINISWVYQFNAHIRAQGQRYTVDYEWLEALSKWLKVNATRLVAEENARNTPRKQRPRPMVM